jgi:hypothetical protein
VHQTGSLRGGQTRRSRPGWWLAASLLLLASVVSGGPGDNVGGSLASLLWLSAEATGAPPPEGVATAASLHDALALTGPRAITVAVGLPDGRQRANQLVEPGAASQDCAAGWPGHRPGLVSPRLVVLAIRGLFAGRGPPEDRA